MLKRKTLDSKVPVLCDACGVEYVTHDEYYYYYVIGAIGCSQDENNGDEMIEIMTHLHQHIPSVSLAHEYTIGTGETIHEESVSPHPILVGGDQLPLLELEVPSRGRSTACHPSSYTTLCQ